MKSPAAFQLSLAFLLFSVASCGSEGGDLAFSDADQTTIAGPVDGSAPEGEDGATSTTMAGAQSTTTVAEPTTTSTAATGGPVETVADGVPAPVDPSQRIDFALFRYSVDVPSGFRQEFFSGRNGYLVWDQESADGVFSAYFDTSNFLAGDEPTDFANYVGDGDVQSQQTIEVPVYRTSNLGETVPGLVVEASEVHFAGGFYGEQWIRIYDLGDRSIVASISIGDDFGGGILDPRDVLDGVRLWEGNFVERTPDQCSTRGLPPIKGSVALNPAQDATLIEISDALINCDWAAIEAALGPDFTASFGGDDAIELWQDGERYDDGILGTLYDLFSLPALIDAESGLASWPRAAALAWPEVDETMKIELEELGYGQQDFIWFEDFGGYFGYRTGIGADGIWQYYVAGD